ncbi:hypothetical protein [Curtobacterium sp. SORGH_AS_0776]|uniref:hypothetical protein n=1 Tax=Curtobacterium sp. SORGH_AS_0776 TaxID=3041798 RepID=UPI0028603185|nr:hypothetical protein [Curtobacterium sp. SORGH_AS_0776]MDR6172666.1 hypothetical protein [Curtobacterium sp. SORGH_AS_0776]
MGVRRRDRWLPPEAFSLSEEARGVVRHEFDPPRPVYAWLQTSDRLIRVDAMALAASDDAVLVEWGSGQAKTSAWIWRTAVKQRRDDESRPPTM